MKKLLPNLNSVREFIASDDYLGKIKLVVSGSSEQMKHLSPEERLEASVKVLEDIAAGLTSDKIQFKGSRVFKP